MDANCVTNRLFNGQFQLYISHPSCTLFIGLAWTDIPSLITHFHSPSKRLRVSMKSSHLQ